MTSTSWPAFAGIDWGGEYHQVRVVDSAGKWLIRLRVAHDVAGLAAVQAELSRLSHRMPIAIERSEGLLVEHLQSLGHALSRCPRGSLLEHASDARSPRQDDRVAPGACYLGLDVLAKSRLALITAPETHADQEVQTPPALTV